MSLGSQRLSIPFSRLYSHRLTGWFSFPGFLRITVSPKPPLIEVWGQMLIDRVRVMGYRDWKAVPVGPNACLNILIEGLSAHTEPVLEGGGKSPVGGEGGLHRGFPSSPQT